MLLLRSSLLSKFFVRLSWIITILILLILNSCVKNEEEKVTPFTPVSTINRLFIIGSNIDNSQGTSDLVLYVNGIDKDDSPFTVASLKTVSVIIGDNPGAKTFKDGDASNSVFVNAVSDGDKILSLTLLSDYSGSIDQASSSEFQLLSNIHNLILDALPNIYEVQVIIFSDNSLLKLDWTESNSDVSSINYQAIRKAVQVDTGLMRDHTALYDAIGFSLNRDTENLQDGLIERCRPARMLVAFSDGKENASTQYTDKMTLINDLRSANVLTIMLGNATADLETLTEFSGDLGAVVYMSDAAAIKSQITNWKDSLSNMVSIRIKPDTLYENKTITLRMGSGQEVVFNPQTGGGCL